MEPGLSHIMRPCLKTSKQTDNNHHHQMLRLVSTWTPGEVLIRYQVRKFRPGDFVFIQGCLLHTHHSSLEVILRILQSNSPGCIHAGLLLSYWVVSRLIKQNAYHWCPYGPAKSASHSDHVYGLKLERCVGFQDWRNGSGVKKSLLFLQRMPVRFPALTTGGS